MWQDNVFVTEETGDNAFHVCVVTTCVHLELSASGEAS